MLKVSIIGVDLAKNVFQLPRAAEDGSVVDMNSWVNDQNDPC